MSDGTIGIVIPVFNTMGSFLDECVASAIDQTIPVSVVVVDDGSMNSETLRSLDAWERRGIRVLRHETNRGVSTALNTGIEAQSTEFIAPVGSDDRLRPSYCARVRDALADDPSVGIVSVNLQQFGARELISRPASEVRAEDLLFANLIPGASAFRRSDWLNLGGFTATASFGEDWDFWLRVLRSGRRAIGLNETLYEYRQHPAQSIVTTIGDSRLAQQLNVVRRNRALWEENIVTVMEAYWRLKDQADEQEARLSVLDRRYGRVNRILGRLAALTTRSPNRQG